MAYSAKQQLENVKYDLRNVIKQLKISSCNLKDVKGLSVEICTQKIDKMIREYEDVLQQLESVQLKKEEDKNQIGE